jgi:hypothetical protein
MISFGNAWRSWGCLRLTAILLATARLFFIDVPDGDDLGFIYLVTARHVVWPKKWETENEKPVGDITIRVNRKFKKPKTIKIKRSDWIFHPDKSVDLCVYPFDEQEHDPDGDLDIVQVGVNFQDDLSGMHLSYRKELHFGVSLGDEVFITGAFVSRLGGHKNIPVVRIGNIAAMAEEPIAVASPKFPAYLVETRSLAGISGSPVFLNLQSNRILGRKNFSRGVVTPSDPNSRQKPTIIFPYLLLGMAIWMFGVGDRQDFMEHEPKEQTERHGPSDADFNSGLSVVLPVQVILNFLQLPIVKEPRMATKQEREKRIRVRPISAKQHADLPATDENPNAREDFTSLLGAAARKQPQDE